MPVRPPNEDLFEESRMSFGEHLEELRVALIRSLIGVVVGCVVGFTFANQVVQLLTSPLSNALTKYEQRMSMKEIQDESGFVPPEWEPRFKRDNLRPETMLVDPGEMAEALGIESNRTEGIELRPYSFRSRDFDKSRLAGLARHWVDPSGSEQETQALYLWNQLESADQSKVQRIADSSTPTDGDVDQLRDIFNRLIENPELSSSQSFEPWVTEPQREWWDIFTVVENNPLVAMKQELARTDSVDLNRRINRVLVNRVFVDQMDPVQLELVPLQVWRSIDTEPQSLATTEGFMIWMKAGVFTGLLVASPWVLWQLWMFVAAGLFPHEKKYVYVFLPISLALFFAGAGLAFFFVFEPVLDFLFSFNASLGIKPQIRIKEWISFVMFLPLGFGVAFQLPLVMLFLNRINVFSVEAYTGNWRIAVMVIFVLSMLLTPADPMSMVMLAIPLTFLYFFGIALCWWLPTNQNPYGDVPPDPA